MILNQSRPSAKANGPEGPTGGDTKATQKSQPINAEPETQGSLVGSQRRHQDRSADQSNTVGRNGTRPLFVDGTRPLFVECGETVLDPFSSSPRPLFVVPFRRLRIGDRVERFLVVAQGRLDAGRIYCDQPNKALSTYLKSLVSLSCTNPKRSTSFPLIEIPNICVEPSSAPKSVYLHGSLIGNATNENS